MKGFFALVACIVWLYPCGAISIQGKPSPFIPEEAAKLIWQASEFYLWNFSVQNPALDPSENISHYLTAEEKAMTGESLKWLMRVEGPMGTVPGLRYVLSEYYAPRVIDEFMEVHFNHFPSLYGKVIYNEMIFSGYGDRGTNLFLELNWEKARLEVIEEKETPQGPVVLTRYFLPAVDRFEQEDENGVFYVEEVPREFEEIIEFLWHEGRWKLNTFIDTFDM